MDRSPHNFHIPVMGVSFTNESPLKIGRFGIDSVMSLGDDNLLEDLRKHWAEKRGDGFTPIAKNAPQCRSRRVQAWCDLVADELDAQMLHMRREPMMPGLDLWRYFALLPEGSLKQAWRAAIELPHGPARQAAHATLMAQLKPGRADVNIMTKVDRDTLPDGSIRPKGESDALAGLLGFANSRLQSAVEFSAGINPRLYGFTSEQPAFLPGPQGQAASKQIIIKISDFRSAEVQGRFLAKKGVWVSEWRIESGLNCGGHAFGMDGQLLGPVLEQMRLDRHALAAELFQICQEGLRKRGLPVYAEQPEQRLSAQGGVGTAEEHNFLRSHYGVDTVGWGSPFLLVPEAVTLDEEHLKLLEEATEDDIQLSGASPLGIPFWNLMSSSSERHRRQRIAEGKPGSPCPQGYLAFDNSNGRPLCHAASAHQRLILKLVNAEVDEKKREDLKKRTLDKSCICLDLSGSSRRVLGIDTNADVAVCPGPNIAYFQRRASLDEMCAHVYGRQRLPLDANRPSMFAKEFDLALGEQMKKRQRAAAGLEDLNQASDDLTLKRLNEAIPYYDELQKKGAPIGAGGIMAELKKLWARRGHPERETALATV
jgi:hypothetical protein